MKQVKRHRVPSEINITPFTDVVLVLLIIFMITTPLIVQSENASNQGQGDSQGQEGGFDIDLPRAKSGRLAKQEVQVIITLLQDGRTVMEGEAIEEEQLKDKLKSLYDKNPQSQIIIQADRLVPHWRVVLVLDMAKSIGLSHLSIATQEETE